MRRARLLAAILLTACAGPQRPAPAAPSAPSPPPLPGRLVPAAGPGSHEELVRAVASAPRRAPNDRIDVVVLDVAVPRSLRTALDARQLQHQLATELRADPLLRVAVAIDACDRAAKVAPRLADCAASARQRGLAADVWILPTVTLDPAAAAAGAIALQAEVASAWSASGGLAEARGLAAEPSPAVKQAGAEARAIVAGQLAAGLPSRAAVARIEAERERAALDELAGKAGVEPDDDAMTRLRKLYEAQQQAGGASR